MNEQELFRYFRKAASHDLVPDSLLYDGVLTSAFAVPMPPLTLSEHGKRMILHALGLSQPRRWSYRNHVAGCGEACEPLVEAGWMIRGRVINEGAAAMQLYHVTDAGAQAAGVLNRFRREDRQSC